MKKLKKLMMKERAMKMASRVSIPGRIIDLLWTDDEFFRDVSSNKKVSSSGKFPRCDQWCDEAGFHMAFALAGYSPDDVEICAMGNYLYINGLGSKAEYPDSASYEPPVGPPQEVAASLSSEEYPPRHLNLAVQQGVIVRGIARRNFKAKYFINPLFDLSNVNASMKNGLLEIVIEKRAEDILTTVKVVEV